MILTAGLMILTILLYNILLFRFTDIVVANRRFGTLSLVLASITNLFVSLLILFSPHLPDSLGYVILFLVLLLEFYLMYKGDPALIFLTASSHILHVMAARAVVTAVFALALDTSIYGLVHNNFWLVLTITVSMACLCISLFLLALFVPRKAIKIITHNHEPLLLLGIYISVFNVYLFFNANIYINQATHPDLTTNQIVAPLAILSGLYLVLIFAMRISILSGYKQKSKNLALAMQNEMQYRESLVSGALMSYEVNLSKNCILNGLENYTNKLGRNAPYSDVLTLMSQELIFSKDMHSFMKCASAHYLLGQFMLGSREAVTEYRLHTPNQGCRWVRAVTSLARDADTGDVRAFTYVKDIDSKKKQQLELQYQAERDSLTGLYNKGMTGKLITENLTGCPPGTKGALFIIDVDNFKVINDRLGHTYGDAVLCELAENLSTVFRRDDIVGRIGGDEFIAFMKTVPSLSAVQKKAEEILQAFFRTYKGDNGVACSVSGSIGIALYPQDGTHFEDLYKFSDIALYEAKTQGKNIFRFYRPDDAPSEYVSQRTEIDKQGVYTQKSFRQNRIEYVFKMLYSSASPQEAIHYSLELVSRHFGFDRGYIFETNPEDQTTSNTFEWCADGIMPEIDNLQNVPLEVVSTAYHHFEKNGTFILHSVQDLPQLEFSVLEPQGIKSMFQFGIFQKDKLLGFIGFDNCKSEGTPTADELDELVTICHVLSTFFVKEHIADSAEKNSAALSAVMSGLNIYAYVVDKKTYRILYANDKIIQLSNTLLPSDICYKRFWGLDAPCVHCPLHGLSSGPLPTCSREFYADTYGLWIELTASYVQWADNQTAYLLNGVDITKYKTPSA